MGPGKDTLPPEVENRPLVKTGPRIIDTLLPEKGPYNKREKHILKLQQQARQRKVRVSARLDLARTGGFPPGYATRAMRRAKHSKRGEFGRRIIFEGVNKRRHATKGVKSISRYEKGEYTNLAYALMERV